jgi:hypothetical protein
VHPVVEGCKAVANDFLFESDGYSTGSGACVLLIAAPASFAQWPTATTPAAGTPDTQQQQAAPLLSPDQLNNLVAPIALYPDPLLSQVLAASTYPLEIVEAQQWLGQNSNLRGTQLMDAAKQQNWDPSVQAMVAFPDALRLLANDVRWTTDLGNAFLSQQADVMSAVQRMRAEARANGKLTTTPQQSVTEDSQGGQTVIEIQPADPQVIYVPIYNPSYVWGSPAWGAYPDLWYPSGYGWGFGWGSGIYMSSYFPGWYGWGGWGWGSGWYGGGLFLNAGFFNHYGYRGWDYGHRGGFWGGGRGGRMDWTHNPGHRMGIPYSNRGVASRFGGGGRMNGGQFANNGRGDQRSGGQAYSGRGGYGQSDRAATGGAGGNRAGSSGGWRSFGNSNRSASDGRSGGSGLQSSGRGGAGSYRQQSQNFASNGRSRSYQAPAQSGRAYGSTQSYRSAPSYSRSSPGYSSQRGSGYSAPRSYSSAPRQSYSAPRSFSSPRSYGGGSSLSSGRSSGGGGFWGGRAGGGGGGGGGHRR